MSCAQIRERTLEIVLASGSGIQKADLQKRLALESPETPEATISAQINEAARRYADRIERAGGIYRLKGTVGASLTVEDPSVTTRDGSDQLKLVEFGFVRIGCFDDDGPHIRRNLMLHSDRNPALYAFVVDGTIMYIGKTTMPLSKRLYFYARPGVSQITNIRNNASIRQMLESGKTVEIWALVDWEPVEHRGIPINVAAGIEDALIERLRPEWNAR
jgi:hypothetical protein